MNSLFTDNYRVILSRARFDADEDMMLYGPPAAFMKEVGKGESWDALCSSLKKNGRTRLDSLTEKVCKQADDFLDNMDEEESALGIWRVQLVTLFVRNLYASRGIDVPKKLETALLWLDERCGNLPLDHENQEAVARCRYESGLKDGELIHALRRNALISKRRGGILRRKESVVIPLGKSAIKGLKAAALAKPPDPLYSLNIVNHPLRGPYGEFTFSLLLDDKWGVNMVFCSDHPLPRRLYWLDRMLSRPSRESKTRVEFRIEFQEKNPFAYRDFLRRSRILALWDEGKKISLKLD